MKNSSVTETKISPFWWNLHHLLHCKFSLCSFQCRQWRKFRQSDVISVSLTWLFHLSVTHRYNKMTHIQIKNLNLNLNLHAGWIQIHDAVIRWFGLASVVGPGALSANFLRLVRVIGVHPSHRALGLWQWNENIMALWNGICWTFVRGIRRPTVVSIRNVFCNAGVFLWGKWSANDRFLELWWFLCCSQNLSVFHYTCREPSAANFTWAIRGRLWITDVKPLSNF